MAIVNIDEIQSNADWTKVKPDWPLMVRPTNSDGTPKSALPFGSALELLYSPDQERDDHGRFAEEGGGQESGGAGGGRKLPEGYEHLEGMLGKPLTVEQDSLLHNEWQDPPPAKGINAGRGGAGGYTSDNSETSMTSLGREGEQYFARLTGGEIIHDVGEKSPLDVVFDHEGFEVKTTTTNATDFVAVPKGYEIDEKVAFSEQLGVDGNLAIVVIDRDAGEASAYYRPGFASGRLRATTGWSYMGKVGIGSKSAELPLGAALDLLDPKYSPDQDRDDHGRFAYEGGGESGGGAGGGKKPEHAFAEITEDEARGNSRAVTAEEFQHLAEDGQAQLDGFAEHASPTTGLDDNWSEIKSSTYDEVQKSWGGATIDAHSGESVTSGYALSAKAEGMATVSIDEHATEDEFNSAMDEARKSYGPLLEHDHYCLGVFHDDDLHRVDIDPVLVVKTTDEVETIGAATHAIGGAYDFSTGNGYWPPHVGAVGKAMKAATVAFQGLGQWWHQVQETRD